MKANKDISKCWYEEVCPNNSKKNPCNPNSCIKYLEIKHLMDSSNIPISKQKSIVLDGSGDYDAYCELNDIKHDIVYKIQSGFNLFICSRNTGNGKTSWAIKLLQKYFDEIWAGNGFNIRALFIHVPTLLLQLKDFENPLDNEYKANIIGCDVVVWDDIAGIELSNYDYNQLLLYIDNRINADKANIFTSNCTTKRDMEKAVGVKLASRIWNVSKVIEFKGNDRRGE